MIKLNIGNLIDLRNIIQGKKIYCFGAGKNLDDTLKNCNDSLINKSINAIVDNNEKIWGSKRECRGRKIEVISPAKLCEVIEKESSVILITNYKNSNEIIEQLDNYPSLNDVPVFISELLFVKNLKRKEFVFREKEGEELIPRVIHYCWFGGKKIPEKHEKYIESWKRHCPDYEIKRWDESNYNIEKNRYAYEAYENKAWAFVSDYARIDIVHKYGGIYLDCDVELLKPIDPFLKNKFFCGFENQNAVNLGLGFGSVKGHNYLKNLLELYDKLTFVADNGDLNMTPCPVYQTRVIRKFGVVPNNSYQETKDISVFPSEVFSPFSFFWGTTEITENTFSIHHFGATWHTDEEKDRIKIAQDRRRKIMNRYKMQEVK